MKATLAGLLLAGHMILMPVLAQPSRPDDIASTGTSTTADGAFTLAIDAPGEVRDFLERHLDVLRYRGLSDLSDSELSRLLIGAEQDAHELLATLGYFSPTIRVEPPASAGGAMSRNLRFNVIPGEPTLVGDVRINFVGPILTDDGTAAQRLRVIRDWSLETGMRFSQTGWAAAKQKSLLQLTAQSYPTAQITTSQADIDPKTHSARLTITLDSGPLYQLGPLVITGLNQFGNDMVRRLVRLSSGAYDQAELVAAQQRLTDSGYFDSAFINLDTKGDPAAAPVLVLVREAKLQKLVLGVGASTDTGARVTIEHTHHKIPVLDWRVVNKLVLARDVNSLTSEFNSHPNDDNWRWSVGTVIQQQTLGSFLVHSQSMRIGRSRSALALDNAYFMEYDRADAATSDANAQAAAEALSANYAFTVRRFDHPLFPSKGWGLGVALGAGTTVGTQNNPYGRVLARWLSYLPLGDSSGITDATSSNGRIALRAQAGAVVAEPTAELPSTQLFFIGGDNSVRGYGYRDLGVPLPNGQVTGGRYMALGSVEWQRPLRIAGRASDWESTVFLDAGSVANNSSELRPRFGFGVGARWKSPVGPLQIDVAYGLEVQRLRLHMNVGFNF